MRNSEPQDGLLYREKERRTVERERRREKRARFGDPFGSSGAEGGAEFPSYRYIEDEDAHFRVEYDEDGELDGLAYSTRRRIYRPPSAELLVQKEVDGSLSFTIRGSPADLKSNLKALSAKLREVLEQASDDDRWRHRAWAGGETWGERDG